MFGGIEIKGESKGSRVVICRWDVVDDRGDLFFGSPR
jgi:hypothetical protein